jgi:hypothetical protein
VEQGTLDARTKSEVIRLGESYAIATPFTSFVAVEKSRVTVGGKPMLVSVPVELPDGTNWNGFFGEGGFDMLPVAVRDGAVGSFVRGFALKAEERGLLDADGAARFDTGWFASLEDGTTLGVAVDALDDPGKDRGALGAARRSPTGDALGKRGTSAPAISGGMPAAKPSGPPGAATNAAAGSAVGGAAASPSASPSSAATASAPTVAVPAASAPADASAEGRAVPPGASTRRFQFGREQAQGQRFAKEELAERDAAAARPSGRSGGFGGGGGSGGVGGAVPAQPLGGGLGGVEKGKSQRPRAAAVDSKVDELVREQAAAGESDQGASPGQRSDDAEAGKGDTADASAEGVELLTIAERDRLVQVLDRRLLVLALAALLGEDARIPAIAGELGLGDAASLEVALKVAVDAKGAIDGAVLESLRALGVRIEDEVAARGLIVARLSPPQLVKAALVAGVRRVEPIVRPG